MSDSDIPLAFMAFIGLDLRAEMGLFVIINSKARGLSSSLTDFHESTLIDDLAAEAPHLYISRKLNEDRRSPWFRLIRYGGETTSGLKRRTSLRMMQKSVSRFLAQLQSGDGLGIEQEYALILSFWRSVARVFPNEWNNHRRHLLTKGVGLYAMTLLLADIVNAANGQALDEDFFVSRLGPLQGTIDWSSKGMFSEAGGRKGAMEVYNRLREIVQP
jgi:DGQHR domain-containing protein